MNVLNIEECELLGDSKYRAYISQVEKALKNFENTSEWADLISALGKLNKVHPDLYRPHSLLCLQPISTSGYNKSVSRTYFV